MISPEYLDLQRELHERNPNYGVSGVRYVRKLGELCHRYGCETILDYGCGKGTLAAAVPYLDIREYDPAIPGKDKSPDPADLTVCTDVLEHIEPDHLDAVLADLTRVTGKVFFFSIHCKPAMKHLADGRNAHLIQEPPLWWLPKIEERMHVCGFAEDMERRGFECWGVPHG